MRIILSALIAFSVSLSACADTEGAIVFKRIVQAVHIRSGITEIVFSPYQYETKFCRYEVLLLRDMGEGNLDRNWRTFIRKKTGNDCGLKLDGFIEIATATPLISRVFSEATAMREHVLEMCLSNANSLVGCSAFAGFSEDVVVSVEGPILSTQGGEATYCFEYWLRENAEGSAASYTQEICADKNGPLSIEKSKIFD